MIAKAASRGLPGFLVLLLAAQSSVQAQGGKEFLQWLKEYSPTGYFIINDYETRANKPGDHKEWLDKDDIAPMPATAVHELGHMRNLELNGKNGYKSYYIGNLQDYKFIPDFKPFSSAEIIPDIPASLRHVLYETYIEGGEGMYSVGSGIIGIMEEWNQYITDLKSVVEMSAGFKAHFNTSKAWDDLANDGTPSVWSSAAFRYFCLRYVMRAKTSHPDVHAKIMADQEFRQCYTSLTRFAEQTMAEWIAVLTERNMDTKTYNGFDWHWKYWNEIQKPEYKQLEQLLLVTPVGTAPYITAPRGPRLIAGKGMAAGRFDIQGRLLPSGSPIVQGAVLDILGSPRP